MKTTRTTILAALSLVTVLQILGPSKALAAVPKTVDTPGPIEYIHPLPWGFAFIITGQPSTCSGTNQWYVRWDNPLSKIFYSTILAAKVGGNKVNIIGAACNNDGLAVVVDLDMK